MFRGAACRFSLLMIVFLAGSIADVRAANSLHRDEDPVVLSGGCIAQLFGEDPGGIVGFRYEGGWVQIPVQVDERDVIDFGAPYDTTDFGLTALMYADTSTFTGPDSDPAFDEDDELVCMAMDLGDERAPETAPDPAGVVHGSRFEAKITDPLDDLHGYVYFFVSDGSLRQDAFTDYVRYDFDLLSGDYKSTYGILSGPNPEDSEATTEYYRVHFSDRWIQDEVNVKAGTATQVDVFDRHKNLFGPGNCGRSEDTFSAGEGCFVANIDGPVRAIRSYFGANSGPFTQRVHKFYERRHDVTTYLRVHAISGVMDYYDYSPDALGMTYYNELNTAGALIDGDPAGDNVTAGIVAWEMVTGYQGTLVIAQHLDTDIYPFTITSYYSDNVTPPYTQCTGDAYEYGASGVWVDQGIPNTDPSLGTYNNFTARRVVYYEEPFQTVVRAGRLERQSEIDPGIYIPVAVSPARPPSGVFLSSPNPFGDRTAIRFGGPAGASPRLRIYDAAGRLVRSFRPAVTAAGEGTVEWDGRDARDNPLPTGVYFARLAAGGSERSLKILLLK